MVSANATDEELVMGENQDGRGRRDKEQNGRKKRRRERIGESTEEQFKLTLNLNHLNAAKGLTLIAFPLSYLLERFYLAQ
jgi:aryl-alcohol dehydrogenase-like predicted oxidoreductase